MTYCLVCYYVEDSQARYDLVKNRELVSKTCNGKPFSSSVNVIIGLCHRFNRKVGTFQESFVACNASFRRRHPALTIGAGASRSLMK